MGKSEKVGKMRFYPMLADWLEFESSGSDNTWETHFATKLIDSDAGSAPRPHLAGYRAGGRHPAVATQPGAHAVPAGGDSRVHSAAGRRLDGAPARAARPRRVADDAVFRAADGPARAAGAGGDPEGSAAIAAAGAGVLRACERMAATQTGSAGSRRLARFRQHPRPRDG